MVRNHTMVCLDMEKYSTYLHYELYELFYDTRSCKTKEGFYLHMYDLKSF